MLFEKKIYHSISDRGGPTHLSDMRFVDCNFFNCSVSYPCDSSELSTFRNIAFENCKFNACFLGAAILDNVLLKDVSAGDLVIARGTIPNRVKIVGRFFSLKMTPEISAIETDPDLQRRIDDVRAKLFSECEWALDITQAKLKEIEINGIPSHLIKINEDSQCFIKRNRFDSERWRCTDHMRNRFKFTIDSFMQNAEEEILIAVPSGSSKKTRDAYQADFDELKRFII